MSKPALPLLALLFTQSAWGYVTSSTGSSVSTDNPDGNRAYSHVFPNGANPGDGADGSKQGEPITFTWSIVPDGTSYFTGNSNGGTARISAIVSYYDAVFSVPAAEQTADLTNRPWFAGFSEGLEIISNRCGITYIYEPIDDGADCILSFPLSGGETDAGVAGARGDMRIAASSDLFSGGLSTTGAGDRHHPEIYLRLQSFNTNGAIRFVVMHETMHALGFSHSTVNGTANQSAVTGSGGTNNGPQFDDICGLHRKYGDFFEKDGGNDTLANATDLGAIDSFETLIIGDDANDTTVAIDEFDFISIDGVSDTDYLKFTVETAGEFILTLDPRGPTYTNVPSDFPASFREDNTATIVADELNNLEFRLFDSSGTLLNTVSAGGLGDSEVLATTLATGDYFVAINGTTSDPTMTLLNRQIAGPQLYAFEIEFDQPLPLTGYAAYVANFPALTDTSFAGDPEGDQNANGLEYVLNGNPLVADILCIDFVLSESNLVFSFDRNSDSTSDTTQVFQFSEDFENWTDLNLTGTIPPEVTIGAPNNGLEPISITIDDPSLLNERLFWRIKVELIE